MVIFYTVQNLYGHFFYGRFLYGHFLYGLFLYSSKFIRFKIYTVQNVYGTKFILQKKALSAQRFKMMQASASVSEVTGTVRYC
jgi:hypothetical protein